jgi:hypothetical protein
MTNDQDLLEIAGEPWPPVRPLCERCSQPHSGVYGSGRFCSSKCARGFSTKAKRKEINATVSAKLRARLQTKENQD